MRDVLDEASDKRTPWADLLTNGDEGALSQKLNGQRNRDFGLYDLERLPWDQQAQWMTRYGKAIGLNVTPISTAQVFAEVLDALHKVVRVIDSITRADRSDRLATITGKGHTAQAGLSHADERKKVAG